MLRPGSPWTGRRSTNAAYTPKPRYKRKKSHWVPKDWDPAKRTFIYREDNACHS